MLSAVSSHWNHITLLKGRYGTFVVSRMKDGGFAQDSLIGERKDSIPRTGKTEGFFFYFRVSALSYLSASFK